MKEAPLDGRLLARTASSWRIVWERRTMPSRFIGCLGTEASPWDCEVLSSFPLLSDLEGSLCLMVEKWTTIKPSDGVSNSFSLDFAGTELKVLYACSYWKWKRCQGSNLNMTAPLISPIHVFFILQSRWVVSTDSDTILNGQMMKLKQSLKSEMG